MRHYRLGKSLQETRKPRTGTKTWGRWICLVSHGVQEVEYWQRGLRGRGRLACSASPKGRKRGRGWSSQMISVHKRQGYAGNGYSSRSAPFMPPFVGQVANVRSHPHSCFIVFSFATWHLPSLQEATWPSTNMNYQLMTAVRLSILSLGIAEEESSKFHILRPARHETWQWFINMPFAVKRRTRSGGFSDKGRNDKCHSEAWNRLNNWKQLKWWPYVYWAQYQQVVLSKLGSKKSWSIMVKKLW